MKRRVFVVASYYVPCVKGGGPIRSLKNLVDQLADRIDFYILTSDRDLGDSEPLDGVCIDQWNQIGPARVFYTDLRKLLSRRLVELIESTGCDTVYLNSFFLETSIKIVLLSKLGRLGSKRIILAPRGELSKGALSFKRLRKRLYISVAKALRLYTQVVWHATAENELLDIQEVFGKEANIVVARNLTDDYQDLTYSKSIKKQPGELRIVFISRIHPKKNLKKAIELLMGLKGKVVFDIYGPIEDGEYWRECQQIIVDLPENITVGYKGILDYSHVLDVFRRYHVFLFPTLGENFGHVVSEALIGGCPVIISDQTPWRNLEERHAGWDIPLSDEKAFHKVLQYCVDMNNEEYDELSRSAFDYGRKMSNREQDIRQTYKLFNL